MKKLINKFFGIDEHGMNGRPVVARYTNRRSNCGWDILCQAIHSLLYVGNEATIALMVLKLIGSITISWGIVLLPAVIHAVFEIIETAVNNKISKICDRLREAYYAEQDAYYAERMKKFTMNNSEDDKYEEDYDDEVYHLK